MAELKLDFEKMAEGFVKTAKERGMFVSRWIPVSEKLPEESGEYLVSVEDVDKDDDYNAVGIAWFAHPDDYNAVGKGEWRELGIDEEVVAWQKLPTPFGVEEGE